MTSDLEKCAVDIAKQVSTALGDSLELSTMRWISQPAEDVAVKDATLAFYVDGKRPTQDIALLISNASFPDAVGEDVARAKEIATCVSRDVARHIISPVCEGRYGRQSWAAFSRLSSLSTYRGLRLLQKPVVSKRLLPWLAALAMDTKEHKADSASYEAYFVRPLGTLAGDPDLSSSFRRFADACSKRVLERRPDLFTVVQHGDFWLGNVMFQRTRLPGLNPTLGDFRVIDWRGARLDGYPCADAIRLVSSLYRANSSKSFRFMNQYLAHLEISDFNMAIYCLLSLGQLAENLDQFPKGRYCQLCEETFNFLRAFNVAALDIH